MTEPWEKGGPWRQALLRACETGYRGLLQVRHRLYDRGLLRSHRAGLPVISVGGLSVGGAGKTPTVIWLAGQATELGIRLAVVSRGYGGRPGRRPLIVSDGQRIVTKNIRLCGDEPSLIAERAPGHAVVVHPDRVAAARRAAGLGVQVLVLDDGHQHRRLHRDLEILLLDARRPLGNARLLPAGPLRDLPAAALRADLVLLSRSSLASAAQLNESRRIARALAPGAVIATASYELGLPQDVLRQPVFVFAGIARPEDFAESLSRQGVDVRGVRGFRDHHPFAPSDLQAVGEAARDAGAQLLITTEKDRVRLSQQARTAAVLPVRTARLELRVEAAGEEFVRERLQALAGTDAVRGRGQAAPLQAGPHRP